MNYLIFSDSHGATRGIMHVIERSLPLGLDGVLFLGDGLRDIERAREVYPTLDYHVVAGNCDIGAKYIGKEWREKLIELDGVRILMMHGQFHNVKYGIDSAVIYARSMGADVLLFGHTHEALEKHLPADENGKALHVFNPGSTFMPRSGEQSFGLMTIKNGSVLLSHGRVNGGES